MAEKEITIELPALSGYAFYRISDNMGRVVQYGTLSNPVCSVDISNLAVGIYIIVIQQDGHTKQVKMIKQ